MKGALSHSSAILDEAEVGPTGVQTPTLRLGSACKSRWLLFAESSHLDRLRACPVHGHVVQNTLFGTPLQLPI